jgi:ATP-dependent DNA helicase RecG
MVSERRNELIAEMLHRVHFIEKWGRGIKLILSKEPDTKFSEVGTKFITTFKRKSFIEDNQKLEKGKEKTAQKTTKKRLVESQQRVLELTKENPNISKKELSEIIGISTTAIDKNIQQLKKKGLLKRIGPDKGGYWEIVNG